MSNKEKSLDTHFFELYQRKLFEFTTLRRFLLSKFYPVGIEGIDAFEKEWNEYKKDAQLS
jgi:hypothetical protein